MKNIFIAVVCLIGMFILTISSPLLAIIVTGFLVIKAFRKILVLDKMNALLPKDKPVTEENVINWVCAAGVSWTALEIGLFFTSILLSLLVFFCMFGSLLLYIFVFEKNSGNKIKDSQEEI